MQLAEALGLVVVMVVATPAVAVAEAAVGQLVVDVMATAVAERQSSSSVILKKSEWH